jgi:hypothetical protein
MKKRLSHIACAAVLFLLVPASAGLCRGKIKFKETKGKLFEVYNASKKTKATKIIEKAEEYVERIFKDLEIRKPPGFWQWERRVKIYLYSNKVDYLVGTHAPKWTSGAAAYESRGKVKTISSWDTEDQFLNLTLPHQITHLIFCEMTHGELKANHTLPFWFAEGYAQLQKDDTYGHRRTVNREIHERSGGTKVYELKTLRFDPYVRGELGMYKRYSCNMAVRDKIKKDVRMYYDRTVCLVGFMRDKYGQKNLAKFIKELREDKKPTFEDAVQKLTGKRMTQKEFEEEWAKYIAGLKRRDYVP